MNMTLGNYRILGLAPVCFILIIPGLMQISCKKEEPRQEDLTIVVEADRSKIAEDEAKLKSKLLELEKEKTELSAEKQQIESAKDTLKGKDQMQEQRLLESEKRLLEKERAMHQREAELENTQQGLQQKKADLEKRSAKEAVQAGSVAEITGRERMQGQRERELSGREADLARREKDLAQREADLAQREASFLRLQGSLNMSRMSASGPRPVAAGQAVNRDAAENAYKNALNKMRGKGVLWEDLPLEGNALQAQIAESKKKGDFAKCLDQIEQLDTLVGGVQINGDFIKRKFDWLNRLVKDRTLSAKSRETVKSLLQKATMLSGDNRNGEANQELNRIYSLLSK